jgi:glycosyltransferase involved in cell wall biosynthesis
MTINRADVPSAAASAGQLEPGFAHDPCVMHVIVSNQVGGAEKIVATLAANPMASRIRHVVALITPSSAVARLFHDSLVAVHEYRPKSENAISYLQQSLGIAALTWLRSIILQENVTIVHLHNFASQVLGTRAAASCQLPVVRTEHSTRVYQSTMRWPFSRWSLRRSDHVVAVSEHVQRVAVAKEPAIADRLQVIHNGVDTSLYADIRRDIDDSRPFTFLMLARLEPRKDIRLALHALSLVPHARLEIVGDGKERQTLESLVTKLGLGARVRFHGFVSDPRPMMASADVALSSAAEEGLGLALLECMAAGLPVVAPPIGGIPECLRTNVSGWLTTDRSVAALAAAMVRATDRDVCRKVGGSAKIWVRQKFSLAAMVQAYGDLYERMLTCPIPPASRPGQAAASIHYR